MPNTLADARPYTAALTTVFTDKSKLRSDHVPTKIVHRAEQIHRMERILSDALRGLIPTNFLAYGMPGTGKTVVTNSVSSWVANKGGHSVRCPVINCAQFRYEYSCYMALTKLTGMVYRLTERRREHLGLPNGLDVGTAWSLTKRHLASLPGVTIIILDEVDSLFPPDADHILYNLTRINSDIETERLGHGRVCVVGVTNRMEFLENIDPRAASSLGSQRVMFPPYDALDLREILLGRANVAFKDGAVDEAVISSIAAFVTKQGGDSRKALQLLLFAGEQADEEGADRVTEAHLEKSMDRSEVPATVEYIKGLKSPHMVWTLEAVLKALPRSKGKPVSTGDVYEEYCRIARASPVTLRRVSDYLAEFHACGLLTAPINPRGRAGRTRVVSLRVTEDVIRKGLDAVPKWEE